MYALVVAVGFAEAGRRVAGRWRRPLHQGAPASLPGRLQRAPAPLALPVLPKLTLLERCRGLGFGARALAAVVAAQAVEAGARGQVAQRVARSREHHRRRREEPVGHGLLEGHRGRRGLSVEQVVLSVMGHRGRGSGIRPVWTGRRMGRHARRRVETLERRVVARFRHYLVAHDRLALPLRSGIRKVENILLYKYIMYMRYAFSISE